MIGEELLLQCPAWRELGTMQSDTQWEWTEIDVSRSSQKNGRSGDTIGSQSEEGRGGNPKKVVD